MQVTGLDDSVLSKYAKVKELFPLAAITCYLLGFIITNIYLSSNGFVMIEVIRLRYIVTGMVFSIFSFSVIVPISSFIKEMLHKNKVDILTFLRCAFINFRILGWYFLVSAITGFLSFLSSRTTPSLLSASSPNNKATDITAWFAQFTQDLPKLILINAYLLLFLIIILAIVVLIITIINPKDKNGIRQSRIFQLKSFAKDFDIKKLLVALLNLMAFLMFAAIISSFATFVIGVNVDANMTFLFKFIANEWMSFPLVSLAAYLIITLGIWIQFTNIKMAYNDLPSKENRWSFTNISYFYFALAISSILTISYSIAVYPNLPQSFGGGRPVAINIISNNDNFEFLRKSSTNNLFLLDRTSNSLLLLNIDLTTNARTIFELQNSEVKAIIFDTKLSSTTTPSTTNNISNTTISPALNPLISPISSP